MGKTGGHALICRNTPRAGGGAFLREGDTGLLLSQRKASRISAPTTPPMGKVPAVQR
jgi:hypothetical protein